MSLKIRRIKGSVRSFGFPAAHSQNLPQDNPSRSPRGSPRGYGIIGRFHSSQSTSGFEAPLAVAVSPGPFLLKPLAGCLSCFSCFPARWFRLRSLLIARPHFRRSPFAGQCASAVWKSPRSHSRSPAGSSRDNGSWPVCGKKIDNQALAAPFAENLVQYIVEVILLSSR